MARTRGTHTDGMDNAVNATTQIERSMTMETIGPWNIVSLTDAKCDEKVARAIHRTCHETMKRQGINIPGNQEHIKVYNRIFNLILTGKAKEVRAIYREVVPAGSLSKMGPVMPREAMLTFRRCIDDAIYTVKVDTKPPSYQEKIEWQLSHAMAEPPKEDTRPGGIWECCRCNSHFATPEPVLQPVCPKCAEETGKGKSKGSSKRTNIVTLTNDIKRFAQGYLSRKGTPTGDAILTKINELRSTIGLEPVSPERAMAASNVEDLM
jgi:hypothetical protein